MKKRLFPFEKLLMLFFYVELMVQLDKTTFALVSGSILALSLYLEGARPYTPVLIIIIGAELIDLPLAVLILIIIGGFVVALCKLYDINVPMKGSYQVGHKYYSILSDKDSLLTSVFYPTFNKGKRVEWIPNRNYNTVLYDIFHIDPKHKRIPYQIFVFLTSYIHKIWLPAEEGAQMAQDSKNPKKGKVIVFSHGLGGHANAYSCFYCNWASQGYTVVSLAHQKDEVCIDYRVASHDDHDLIKTYLFEKRNRDLRIRVEEVKSVLHQIIEKKALKNLIGLQEIQEVILAGQSYGGATVLATKSSLNQASKNQSGGILGKISKIIALDPWLFPFDDNMFAGLTNEPILIINSQHFYEEVPEIYCLQSLFKRLAAQNPNMEAFMVPKTDHLSQSDMAYVFGNILQFTGSIKHHHLTDKLIRLYIFMMQRYLEGESKEEIIKSSNAFAREYQIDKFGIQIKEEYRNERALTFSSKV